MSANAPEFTVSELAGNVKRTIEEAFGRVRVRGELGRVTIARSGHCYLDLKDDKAVINSIIWKGSMARLGLRPEEGMEVVATGRMSTYPGRSNYQLIIDSMEMAGEGALMALLEKRKKALAAEGLFADERKRRLPFMPRTIGVVTSPTGAVIRDILHRIEDRFPVHVLVWPVLVQGDRAAAQIAGAITGFNNAQGFPRPDTLIVARGGGSLEDLWCFNEEVVARAAANSRIPLISAVGHETDWTIIDYVADARAPTPTGAAEVAVPVRADWLETVDDLQLRLVRGLRRTVGDSEVRLRAAKLPSLNSVLADTRIRFDRAQLPSPNAFLAPRRNRLAQAYLPAPTQRLNTARAQLQAQRLPSLDRVLNTSRESLDRRVERLASAGRARLQRLEARVDAARLNPAPIARLASEGRRKLAATTDRLAKAATARLERDRARLERAAGLLDALSYQGVLQRGYALVRDADGAVVRSAETPEPSQPVTLTFADGSRQAVIDGASARKRAAKKKAAPPETPQQSLF